MKLETVTTGKQFFERQLKEKELQLEQSIHKEISLKAENEHLKQKMKELQEQFEESNIEKQAFTQKMEELEITKRTAEKATRMEEKLIKELKESKAELSEYKQKTFSLLEELRHVLQELVKKSEELESTNFKLDRQFKQKEQAYKTLNERYQKMLNTKIMKWTGTYWKLRRKILLKSK
ncbi:hypothetical protein HB912_06615 [Listeria aquatica]|uniref:Uncharacterized protein n=1 Tax=Listeria aquatica TaxID=1494960 RepID=A0A841ZPR1_9LIST|nr:hypothetical protein [Listeria aquatica]MBC1521314.1 hypothetical protein [Listeria aquatica]